jgi:hypothetical protein
MKLQVTEVFERTWAAINEPCPECMADEMEVDSCEFCLGSGRRYKYIIEEGTSRSSKTFSLIDVCDLYARSFENKRITIWRDTKTDCVKTVLSDYLKRMKQTSRYMYGQKFNRSNKIFHHINDSTVEIHGTDDQNTVHGLTQDVAWFNEPYLISRDVFDQIDQRTSDFVIIDWNPKEQHWVDDIKKDKRAILIHSTFMNNPFCPPEQKAKILSYQPVRLSEAVLSKSLDLLEANQYDCQVNPSKLTKSMVDELLRCQENELKRSASEYKWKVYGLGVKAERPNRIFFWKEIHESEFFALDTRTYHGVDWGSVDPWGIISAKYKDGKLFLHERNYESENSMRSSMTSSTLNHIRSQEEGIVTWLFRRLQIPTQDYIICDNNRPNKIKALRTAGWEYALAADKSKGTILDGIDLLNTLDVYYTHTSTNLKNEQESYSRLVDRYGIVLEEPEDDNNHLIDPTRYLATFLQSQGVIRK